jgi:hypothetical protein
MHLFDMGTAALVLNFEKNFQVCVWCLTLAVPNITPIIVAALPISNDMNADRLMHLSKHIIEGLLDQKVLIVSYACDGTEVERSVQRLLTLNTGSTICYTIKNPRTRIGGSDLILKIPIINGQAISMVQDSKQALMTLQNNLFSGARLLVLGNYVALYSNIRAVAFEENSPLYMRDVEKLDRQDDNAATRLFSSETLDFISKKHPEFIGEIVYLFVFGDLIESFNKP